MFALRKDCRYRLAICYCEGLTIYCGPDRETVGASVLAELVYVDAQGTISDELKKERQVRCEDLK